jgi:predicted nucleic acid-binding protein
VIAVDTNILVYAHRRDSEFHPAAAAKVRELTSGRAPWALPWPCLHEFFSIVTHLRRPARRGRDVLAAAA